MLIALGLDLLLILVFIMSKFWRCFTPSKLCSRPARSGYKELIRCDLTLLELVSFELKGSMRFNWRLILCYTKHSTRPANGFVHCWKGTSVVRSHVRTLQMWDWIVTWLILPVVICLSQRLSHACLSINKFLLWNCEWLIKSVIVYLMVTCYMDNCGNSRANTCWKAPTSGRGVFIR